MAKVIYAPLIWLLTICRLPLMKKRFLAWHAVAHVYAAFNQAWGFAKPESLEFAASIDNPDGLYAEATVEVYVGIRFKQDKRSPSLAG